MRVDDWNDDAGEEPQSGWMAPPAPPVPAPPAAPPAAEAQAAEKPGKFVIPPLRLMWSIYLIGGLSLGMICVMFAIIMVLIAGR